MGSHGHTWKTPGLTRLTASAADSGGGLSLRFSEKGQGAPWPVHANKSTVVMGINRPTSCTFSGYQSIWNVAHS